MAKAIKKMVSWKLEHYVCFSIGIVLFYTIIEFVVSTITQVSHDTLSTCVYGFFGGEVITCALIKIWKLKTEDNKNDS